MVRCWPNVRHRRGGRQSLVGGSRRLCYAAGAPDDPDRVVSGGYTDTIGAPSNPLFLAEGWTGDSRGWVTTRVVLGDLAGRRVLLRWRMACDDTAGTGHGWWLDDIKLAVEHPCQTCTGFSAPPGLEALGVEAGVDDEQIEARSESVDEI